MTVYVIVQLEMNDRAAHDRYQARFFDVFRKFSGRLLSADDNPRVREPPSLRAQRSNPFFLCSARWIASLRSQ
jgi:uncharacterized protein (DUF1330 family)